MQSKQTIDKLKDYDFLQTILANLPAVAFVIAPDGTVLFAEGMGIALAGLKKEDVLGTNVSNYFSQYTGFEEKVRRVLEGETITSTVIAPNQRSLEVTYSPMRDDRGSICAVIGIAQDVTERIEREQTLRERESWFRAIFESAQDSIFIKDESLRYVQVSPAMEQLFGLPARELVGKTDEDLFGPEAGAHLREVDARVLDGEVVEEENTKPVNGEPRSFHVIKAPMRDATGTITGLCGIARDITERKRVEERMQKSESLHRALIETTDTGYVVVDDQGVVLDANPEYVRLTGRFKLEEIRGKSVVDWTADHDKEKNAKAVEECSQKGFIRNLELDYVDSKGNIIPVEINATVIERCGTPIILSMCRDITERKRAEEELLLKDRALSSSVNAAMINDLDGKTLYVNDAFLSMFGYSREEAYHLSASDLAFRQEYNELAFSAIRSQGFFLGESSAKHKNGSPFPVQISASLITDDQGRPIATIGSFVDITERKRAEEALRESREILQAVLNSIPVRVFWKDIDSRFLGCNMPFARDAGFEKPEDIIGKNDYAMGWREQAELYRADDRGVIESGNAKLHIEEPQTTPSGEQIHLLTSKVPLRDVGGAIVGVLGVYQDITDRKRTEEELAESEQKFRTLFENMKEGVALHEVIYDEHGHPVNYRICDVNPAYEKHTGISPDIARGKLATDLYGTDSPPYLGRWAKVADNGEPNEFEMYFEPMQKHFRISAVSPARGTFATVFLDITEQKRQEAAIRESEEKLRSLFRVAPIGIGLVKDRVILDANERLCQMTGYSRDELLGQSARILYSTQEEFELVGREKYRQISEDGTGTVETHWQHKNGSICHVVLSSTPLDASDLSKGVTFTALDVTDRKQAEQALREKAEELDRYFTNALDLLCIADTEGYFRRLNKEWEAVLGYPLAELEGCRFLDLIHADDLESTLAAVSQLADQKEVLNFTNRYRCKDGSYRWIEWRAFPAGDLIYACARDITERKQAEERLRGMQAMLNAAIEQSPSGILIADAPDVRIRIANRAAIDIRGANTEGLTDIAVSEHSIRWQTFYPDGTPCRPEDLPLSRAILAGETTRNAEVIIRDEDGVDHWVSVNAAPVRDAEGEIQAGIVVFHDITQRKQAEEALRESENAYRAIFENTGNATMIIEGDRTISLVNSEYERLTGYTKAETEGKMHWTKLVVEEDLDRMLDQHRLRRIDSSAALKSYEFRMRIKNGMVKDIFLSIDMIPGTAKSVASFVDITASKRAQQEKERLQQQLQQSQKLEAIGTMAGGIAHDFNNILTGILGFTELVRSEIPEGSEASDNLAEVVKAGRRARDLVKQILSFSRRAETEKSLISLVTIVKDALKLIRSITPAHISIKQNLVASPARAILADPTQMHQVVLNLCINAADAMPDGGVLEVSLEEMQVEAESCPEQTQLPSGCYLRLTVRDNGAGMSPEVRERVFEPYFTTKQVGKGTGMGLAVVHGIVKEHVGTIAVSSSPGQGTAFEICLPIVEATPDTEIVSSPVVVTGCESILFVDDETMITNLQRAQLGKWGYRVTATESSTTALGMFRASPRDFDLVITDQSMPGLSGVKLAQAIHEISPNTPIILCTGFDEGISRENAGKIGIHAILTKPITGAEFSCTIRMVLDKASKLSPAKS